MRYLINVSESNSFSFIDKYNCRIGWFANLIDARWGDRVCVHNNKFKQRYESTEIFKRLENAIVSTADSIVYTVHCTTGVQTNKQTSVFGDI